MSQITHAQESESTKENGMVIYNGTQSCFNNVNEAIEFVKNTNEFIEKYVEIEKLKQCEEDKEAHKGKGTDVGDAVDVAGSAFSGIGGDFGAIVMLIMTVVGLGYFGIRMSELNTNSRVTRKPVMDTKQDGLNDSYFKKITEMEKMKSGDSSEIEKILEYFEGYRDGMVKKITGSKIENAYFNALTNNLITEINNIIGNKLKKEENE